MRKIFLILFLLITGTCFAAETPRWVHVVNEDATASSYTAHWDVDNDGYEAGCDGVGVETGCEVRVFAKWIVYNPDTTDTAYCDANSNASGTQNTAVNDGSKPTSEPIPAGATFTFTLKYGPRSTISCICTAGQTCTGLTIRASEPN